MEREEEVMNNNWNLDENGPRELNKLNRCISFSSLEWGTLDVFCQLFDLFTSLFFRESTSTRHTRQCTHPMRQDDDKIKKRKEKSRHTIE